MRIASPGIARTGRGFEFTFEGARVPAHPGESIAAALIASGHWWFRDARGGGPRGMYCGMGVCGECQVRIDGVSGRACLEPARPGLSVARQPALAPVDRARAPADATANWREVHVDLLVVGAGPAGLSAARVAAAGGLDVLVVDERSKAGGQFFKQPGEGFAIDEARLDQQYREGRELYAHANAAGARFLFGATAWGVFAADALAVAVQGGTWLVRPRRLVVATGAYERAVPIPGWTLPGYLTTGAAQTLLRASQVAPGQRVLVAGNGPLNLQVACELAAGGARVVAVAELAASALHSPLAVAQMALASPSLLFAGMRLRGQLMSHGVPVLHRHALIAVEGAERAQRGIVAKLDASNRPVSGTQRAFDVDAVCVNHGFVPQSELARALGCEFEFQARTQSWLARRDDDGRTSVPGVFIAGDAGGLQGARYAIVQGALAAATALCELRPSGPVPREAAQWRRHLARHRRFQSALWRVFGSQPLTSELAEPPTLICRCEEVARSGMERELGEHAGSFSVVKRATRAGMGRCQGRYCGPTLAALMYQRFGVAPRASDFFAPRAPFRPVCLAQIAGATGDETAPIDVLRTNGRDANIFP